MAEVDYKELYYHAMFEMEQVIRRLIKLQQECEEAYMAAVEATEEIENKME